MTFSIRQTSDTRVNEFPPFAQSGSSVADLPGGGWVVTWQSNQDNYNWDIRQRVYSADGIAGPETEVSQDLVNDLSASIQYNSSVTALHDDPTNPSDGGWVVTWQSDQNGTVDIYQRRYTSSGIPDDDEIRVDTASGGTQSIPNVTALPDGGWLVTWQSNETGTLGIYQRRYASDGTPAGVETRIDSGAAPFNAEAAVTVLETGGWVVTWTATGGAILQRHFAPDGTPGAESRVDPASSDSNVRPEVAALENGGWVVTWSTFEGGNGEIFQRVYDPAGNPGPVQNLTLTSAFEDNAKVASLADGGWVVTWESNQNGTYDIVQRVFDSQGNAGAATRVDTSATSDQTQPSLAALDGGGWVVTWQSGENLTDLDIRQRVFGTFTAAADTATGTAGDDVCSVTAGQFTAGDAIDGGDGVDTVELVGGGTFTFSAVSFTFSEVTLIGIESFKITGDNTKVVFAATVDFGKASLIDASQVSGTEVAFTTGALDAAQRATLFAQGFYTVTVAGQTFVNEAPTGVVVTATATTITENTPLPAGGLKVADIAVTDDGEGSNQLSLSGADAAHFEIVGTELYFVGPMPDFETKSSYAVTVAVDDLTAGGSPDASQSFTLAVTDIAGNEAPTGVVLTATATTITENTPLPAGGLKVADLAVTDDGIGSNELSLSGTDAAHFTIVGTELYFIGPSPDLETKASYEVTVVADDLAVGGSPDASQVFTLAVTEVNDAPALPLPPAVNVAENTTLVATFGSPDQDAGANGTVAYELSGLDADLFEIKNGDELHFKIAPDFEALATTTFSVSVDVNDGGSPPLSDTKSTTVTVTDVNEAPTGPALSKLTIIELAKPNAEIGTLSALDPDVGAVLDYQLTSNPGGLFKIVGDKLVVIDGAKLDFERVKSHVVKVQVSDGTLIEEKEFTIAVTDRPTENTSGTAGHDVFWGGAGTDILRGGLGHDQLKGGGGRDTLSGGDGNDRLWGGLANDILTGGKGVDRFVFDTKLGSTNVDVVKDFNVKDDMFLLDNAVFTRLGKAGTPTKPVKLGTDAFHLGKVAGDAEDRILYDRGTGALYYDRDGTGSAAAVKFAVVANKVALTAADFFVI